MIYHQMMETDAEKSKFEQIYLNYRGLMFCVANGILHNEQDAEDAVHQAFVSIAENIEKISQAVCPKTQAYVVIIAENKAIDLYRRNARRKDAVYSEETMDAPASPDESGDLADLILRLPPRYREVLMLRFDQGYSNEETAKLLRLSPDAERKLVQRAKHRLKELMEEGETI